MVKRGQMRLVADNLAGERGGELLFSGVNFVASAGSALVVTGPNGAGKSTLLRIVAGLLPAAAGNVRVDDLDGGGRAAAIAYLGHQNGMKTALSVGENLAFWRDFLGDVRSGVDEALDRVGLPGISHLPFGYLSTGQRRRVAIARLLICYRPVWLLDEPTSGLDAESERMFCRLMTEHRAGGGIVVAATHVALGLDGAEELRLSGNV